MTSLNSIKQVYALVFEDFDEHEVYAEVFLSEEKANAYCQKLNKESPKYPYWEVKELDVCE